jgi:FMN reductase [NAD(P)H]
VEFRDVLAQRRMHRSFLPDPVAEESIERIVRTIRRAPSGGYSQGQSLVVVTDAGMRRRIAEAFDEQGYVEIGSPPFISTAPLHIVVSANERHYHERYNEPDKLQATGGVEITWPVPYWFVDAGALMMLIQLAAIDEGLASAFIGHPEQKRIFDKLLGLPADVVPIGLALIGHPAEDPLRDRGTSRMRARRRPLEDVVHREGWGSGSG